MVSVEAHARLSPSSMERRFVCVGSLALEERYPKTSSRYADEGTAAHELAEIAFKKNLTFLGKLEGREAKNGVEFDETMIEHIEGYVARIRDTVENYKKAGAKKVELYVERRVHFDKTVGVKNSFGTSDVIIMVFWKDGSVTIDIEDLKYGVYQVEAEDNKQMKTYALAVIESFADVIGERKIRAVRMVIHQPKLDHAPEDTITYKELMAFKDELRPIARKAIRLANALRDGETTIKEIHKKGYLDASDNDACHFCRAKAACPAATKKVFKAISSEFDDLDAIEDDFEDVEKAVKRAGKKLANGEIPLKRLSKIGTLLDYIEDYTRAVRGHLHAALLEGLNVPDWKLVKGRKGNSMWTSLEAAEDALMKMRFKREDIFVSRLISPTVAKKLLKGNPRRLNKILKLISQRDGQPSVAHISDKRPAFDPTEDFDDLTVADEFADLLSSKG